jgi:hypothetical protein
LGEPHKVLAAILPPKVWREIFGEFDVIFRGNFLTPDVRLTKYFREKKTNPQE